MGTRWMLTVFAALFVCVMVEGQTISFDGVEQMYSACEFLDSDNKVTVCWTANETYMVFAGSLGMNPNGNGWFGIGLNTSTMVPSNASIVSKFGTENATVKLYGLSDRNSQGVVPLNITWELIKVEVTSSLLSMEVTIPYSGGNQSQFPLIYAYGEVDSGTLLKYHGSSRGSSTIDIKVGNGSSTGSNSNATSDDGVCFPADAKVLLESGQVVAMENLRVGDKVLTSDGSYSEVFFFSHRVPRTSPNSFMEISAEDISLALSPSHYIAINGRLTEARTVKVGDTISTVNEGAFKTLVVSSVSKVVKGGLYNPHTFAGNIVVNAVSVSCYTSTVDPRMAHLLLAPLRMLYSMTGLNLLPSFFDVDRPFLAQLAPSGPSTM
uniref:Hint domain-containing protein n=1 Tax=Compsopogon caeruleus TaxID=31354 RepID=A0A7S1XBW5_9RHOD|mmetsp:Transcript_14319/g.29348  ORF Transcript_14319/g.29348 Transcript_14319/m.29348 type:complete len:379 (+) Transcript_14319:85-1221(+)|eukprot:CAMPEP_0184682572 /NCGR_PEP_ID=MMETSP0312-20130426/7811_1 /TAXON_ID=31354 /ORGANISM="Compsopogon coeruleus, Strain SAG 36.94" /LENGTH=378 /DNA_ID=CAMNT_0027134327 /DNA_START=60 /DNA_END=1196 /DNA_ORIENTATION=+